MSYSSGSPNLWIALTLLLASVGCSSMSGIFGPAKETYKPISNPFADYRISSRNDPGQNIILRTKKGDRSVEVELPGDSERMSDFVLPVSPAFKDSLKDGRSLASSGAEAEGLDESYKDRTPSSTDREITAGFPQSVAEDSGRRAKIERGLNLAPSEDEINGEKSSSYLASMDHIKQLYKRSRYEAALLETDEMIKLYQTDAKLHEMRGTLLDRLGRRELAIKSWSQALRFDPQNESLKRFIERKQLATKAASP